MFFPPRDEPVVEIVGEEDFRVRGANFAFIQYHAKSQTGGAAAVSHALLQIKVFSLPNQVASLGKKSGQKSSYCRIVSALLRKDERHSTFGKGNQLAVEKVRSHRVLQADSAGGNTNQLKFFSADFFKFSLELIHRRVVLHEGLLVIKVDVLVADARDVIVKNSGINRIRVLLCVHRRTGLELMQSGDRR